MKSNTFKLFFFVQLLSLFCLSHGLICHCSACANSTCYTKEGLCLSIKQNNNVDNTCLEGNFVNLHCTAKKARKEIRKCCSEDHCNDLHATDTTHLFTSSASPSLTSNDIIINIHPDDNNKLMNIIIPVLIFVLVSIPGFRYIYNIRKDRILSLNISIEHKALNIDDLESGSGSGGTCLYQKTIRNSISMIKHLHGGRYGQVWLGKFKDDQNVAIKVFKRLDEENWSKEMYIYDLPLISHRNIVGFLAAHDNVLDYWIILEYCSNGSLQNVLINEGVPNIKTMLNYLRDISRGLQHLHHIIRGVKVKPSIAHRDIKTNNILVKENGTLCIADLGMAIAKDENLNLKNFQIKGTVRYLAPELLNFPELVSTSIFEKYIMCDIYAVSLVFWEIINRTTMNDITYEYEQVYQNDLPTNPCISDLKKLIYYNNIRPVFKDNMIIPDLSTLLEEMWVENADERILMLKVIKRIEKIRYHFFHNDKVEM